MKNNFEVNKLKMPFQPPQPVPQAAARTVGSAWTCRLKAKKCASVITAFQAATALSVSTAA